jgi:MoxR-like ATPase
LDRFLLRINIGYPALRDEVEMVRRQKLAHPLESLERVISVEELLEVQMAVKEVEVSSEIEDYIVNIVNATRSHGELYLGASPRGSLGLYRTAQARAALEGRGYVIPDDVKALAASVLSHRMILGSAARIREVNSLAIVDEILNSVHVPGGEVIA